MHGLTWQNADTEFQTSKQSGNRARQSCGFFTSGRLAGRGREHNTRKGNTAHRLCSGLNLPAASVLPAVNPFKPEQTMTKHTPSVPALKFHDQKFTLTHRNGQPWLRGPQIADALGYAHGRQRIQQLYEKHAAEFTDSMTALVKLKTKGGEQEVRIFSLRGAHLLGMFARTERAAEFRRWVLDILDADTEGTAQRRAKPGANLLPAQPVPQARAGMTHNLRQRINRKAHEIALKQYDTIHAFITSWVEDNLACGATEAASEGYIETAGELADGTVLANIRDLKELVMHVGRVIDEAGSAIATIRAIEKRSGYQLHSRPAPLHEWENPEFHKHDRLVQQVLARIAGEDK